MTTESPNRSLEQIGLFLLFCVGGILALGPIQFGNIVLPNNIRVLYKVSVPLVFGILAFLFHKSARFHPYWQVAFGFFVGSTAFLIAWVVAFFFPLETVTIVGFSLNKLRDMLIVVTTVILLTTLSGSDLGSLYLRRGNLRLGLIIGIITFTVFAMLSIPLAMFIFYGHPLILQIILSWVPWIAMFVFSNAMLEELLYRGLFLQKYASFFGPHTANFLQALIFASIHFYAVYTPEPHLFLILTFFLGLSWGYIIQRTDSLLGAVLFHAGTDIPVIIGVFSNM